MPTNEPTRTTTRGTREVFRTIETLRDPDGVVAIISERVKDGRISFMIGREFTRGDRTEVTAYLARRHIPAVFRILQDLPERLELAEDRSRAAIRDREPA